MEKKLITENIFWMKEQIVRFNELMDNDINNKNLIGTYAKLTEEEFRGEGEFLQSFLSDDKEGMLDGLIDLTFTSFYWYLLEGHTFKEEFIERLINVEADMTSLKSDVEDLKYSIDKGLSYYTVNTLIRILAKESIQSQFDILGAFFNILESNLSKLVLKGSVDTEKELVNILAKGRYADVSIYEKVSDDKVYYAFKAMKDIQNGVTFKEPKLIKTSLFKEPELRSFIY